jgi:hypothetical protein
MCAKTRFRPTSQACHHSIALRRQTRVLPIAATTLALLLAPSLRASAQAVTKPTSGDAPPGVNQQTTAGKPNPIAKVPPSAGLEERLDSIQSVINKLSSKIEANSAWTPKDIAYLITAIVALGGLWLSHRTIRQTRALTIQQMQRNADEAVAKSLEEKLEKFYGPLIQLRNTSRLLYKIFTARQKDSENFSTLISLLAGTEFKGNDGILLDEIIRIGEETEQLILKSSGLVDANLQPLLGRATTHYRVLRLAHEKKLTGEAALFSAHRFPLELDVAIMVKVVEIENKIRRFRTIDVKEATP